MNIIRLFLCLLLINNKGFTQKNQKINFGIQAENSFYLFFNPIEIDYFAPELQLSMCYTLTKRWDIGVGFGFLFSSRKVKNNSNYLIKEKRENHFCFPVHLQIKYKFNEKLGLSTGIGYSFVNYEDEKIDNHYLFESYNTEPSVRKNLGYIVPLFLHYRFPKRLNFLSIYGGVKMYFIAYNDWKDLQHPNYEKIPVSYYSLFMPNFGLSYNIPSCRPKTKTIE